MIILASLELKILRRLGIDSSTDFGLADRALDLFVSSTRMFETSRVRQQWSKIAYGYQVPATSSCLGCIDD